MGQSAAEVVDSGQDEPLKLAEACKRFFGGRITPATLRAEHRRGRLVIERIGRTDFVTPRAIEDMRRKCRLPPSDPGSGSDQPGATETEGSSRKPSGSSSTGENITPRDAMLARLNARIVSSKRTSPPNTKPNAKRGTRIQ